MAVARTEVGRDDMSFDTLTVVVLVNVVQRREKLAHRSRLTAPGAAVGELIEATGGLGTVPRGYWALT